MHHPQLYLGLIGFHADAHARVRRWLDENARHTLRRGDDQADASSPMWRALDFQEANTLLLCGAGVEPTEHP